MPVLTCPQCSAQVHVAEGAKPSCSTCGFGDAGPRQPAAGAPPAPAAPTPSRPAAPAGGSRGKVVALTLAAAVVVAAAVTAVLVLGGGEEPRALSQEEAEEVAGLAMANLAADMQSAGGGDLRSLSGTFTVDAGEFGGGVVTATIEMEWGRDEASRFEISIRSGPSQFGMEGYCFPDRGVMILGEEVYEVRPDPEVSCMDFLMDDTGDGMSPIDFQEIPGGTEGMEVTPHGDGTVTATFSDEEGSYTLHVDERGRATRLKVESPDGGGAFDVSYGARSTLTAPEATGRIPSSVGGFCIFFDGVCEYEAIGGDEAPLSDFEVRVYADGATPDDDPGAEPLAVFALDGGDQTSGGFSFTLTENGNGTFGDGDSFTVTAPDDDHEVVVWDLWADRDVQFNPTPAPALAWVALALLGAALVRRR